MKKTELLQIRITEKEREKLKQLADERDMTVSEVIRDLIRKETDK